MKFIVDSMLGKLAKRLRILGYDTLFKTDIADSEIMRIAKQEGRYIVTRDMGIAKIRGMHSRVILIKSSDLTEQLKEFSSLTKIRFDEKSAFSRCPECNNPVIEVNKDQIKDLLPKMVYDTLNKFSYCQSCKKAYWQGTHFNKLIKELKNI